LIVLRAIASTVRSRSSDEVLAAGPVAIEEGTGRSWPIFEAASINLVTDRVAG
jgi:hypothetical protein